MVLAPNQRILDLDRIATIIHTFRLFNPALHSLLQHLVRVLLVIPYHDIERLPLPHWLPLRLLPFARFNRQIPHKYLLPFHPHIHHQHLFLTHVLIPDLYPNYRR